MRRRDTLPYPMVYNTSKHIKETILLRWLTYGILITTLLMAQGCQKPSEEEVAWTKQLPQNLRDHPAFVWPEDHKDLPNILILGGQRSVDLTLPLRTAFDQEADVYRIPAIPSDEPHDWESLTNWISVMPWNLLLVIPESDEPPTPAYLDAVIDPLNPLGKTIIYATASPLTYEIFNSEGFQSLIHRDVLVNTMTGESPEEEASRIHDSISIYQAVLY